MLSPNYPHNYTRGQSCSYDIVVPGDFGKHFKRYFRSHAIFPSCLVSECVLHILVASIHKYVSEENKGNCGATMFSLFPSVLDQ